MVFDADNLLSEDYISRMNETFSDGYRIITSYRNSKNYGDNWISAGYALWFLRRGKIPQQRPLPARNELCRFGNGIYVQPGDTEKLRRLAVPSAR